MFSVALVLATGFALMAPTSALASVPTALTSGVHTLGSSGAEAIVSGSVAPGLQETRYHVAYASITSPWCTSQGGSGTPQATTPGLLRSNVLDNEGETVPGEADEGEAAEKVEVVVTGLTAGDAYCLELVATNASGTAHGGQLSYVAGMPEVLIKSLYSTSAGRVELQVEYSPELTGTAITAYVEYAPTGSEWCESHGAEGSASRDGLASTSGTHFEFEIGTLPAGQEYCIEAFAEDSEGKSARSPQATFTVGAPSVGPAEHQQPGPTSDPGLGLTNEQQIGPSSDRIEGAIDPAEQETEYFVEYSLASSKWCVSGGTSGTPEHVTQSTPIPPPEVVAPPIGVRVELTGLILGSKYCAELVAKNASGATDSGEIALSMGAPALNNSQAPPPPLRGFLPLEETVNLAGVGNYRLGFNMDPNGEETEYFAEYGLASSEWCRTEGDAGTPEATISAARLSGGFGVKSLSVEVAALKPNRAYCVVIVATNSRGTVRNFELLESWSPLTETISLAGSGSGTVTGKISSGLPGPGPLISCPGACTTTYLEGDASALGRRRPPQAFLIATPATGSSFAGWSGDCTNDLSYGIAATCCPPTQTACAVRLAAGANTTIVTFDATNPTGGDAGNGGSTGGNGSTSGGALACTLSPNSRVKLIRRKSRRRWRLAEGRLSVGVSCDRSASVTLSGTLTEFTVKKRGHCKKSHCEKRRGMSLALAASKMSLQAGKTETLAARLPLAAIKALKSGVAESVALALTGSGTAANTTASATVSTLKLA